MIPTESFNGDLLRMQVASRSEAQTTLRPKQWCLVNDANPCLAIKRADGSMKYVPIESTNALFNSLKLSGLAGVGVRNIVVDADGNLTVGSLTNNPSKGSLTLNISDSLGAWIDTGLSIDDVAKTEDAGIYNGILSWGGFEAYGLSTIQCTAGVAVVNGVKIPFDSTSITPTWSAGATGRYSIVYYDTTTNSVGSVGMFLSNHDRRTKCILGTLTNATGNLVTGSIDDTYMVDTALNYMRDLLQFARPKSGLVISGQANQQLNLSGGSMYYPSTNYNNDPLDPHTYQIDAQTPMAWYNATRDAIDSSAIRNTISSIATQYDLNGTLTAVADNRFQNLRVYATIDNSQGGTPLVLFQRGQQIYISITLARDGLATEQYIVNPACQRMILIGIISVRGNAVVCNDADQVLISVSDVWGQLGSNGGASTSVLHNELGGINAGDIQHLTVAEKAVVTDADVQALANLSTTGLLARTGSGGLATRTIGNGDGSITITNGNGVTASPAITVTFEATSGNIKAPNSIPNAGTSPKSPRADHVHPLPKETTPTTTKFLRDDGTWQTISSAVENLDDTLFAGNNGEKRGITNLGNLDSGDLPTTQTGKWEVSNPTSVGNTPNLVGMVVNTTANGAYTQVGTRDAGSGYGVFPYYRRGTTQWYLIRQGWYWLVTDNLASPEWATSIAYGAGGLSTPDGFYLKYGTETSTSIYVTMTAGSAIVDALVVKGSLFCDEVVKANNGFNVNGNLAITENMLQYKELSSLIFGNRLQLSCKEDIKFFLGSAYSGAPSGTYNSYNVEYRFSSGRLLKISPVIGGAVVTGTVLTTNGSFEIRSGSSDTVESTALFMNIGTNGDVRLPSHENSRSESDRVLTTSSFDNSAFKFTPTANGLVPLSGGGTSTFLRADGTWTTTPSSGGSLVGATSSIGAGNYENGTVRTFTVTLTGAVVGNPVVVTPSLNFINAMMGAGTSINIRLFGYVSATNTVTIKASANGGAVYVDTHTFSVAVLQ